MSWQAYVDDSLLATRNVDKAAIFSAAGDSVWAKSKDFQASPEEISAVLAAFNDKAEVKKCQSEGLYMGGERFVVIKAEDRSIYGRQGREGIIVVKTQQALLVTHYPESVQPGVAANTVERLADYLISVGF